jgi:hypothetical protein
MQGPGLAAQIVSIGSATREQGRIFQTLKALADESFSFRCWRFLQSVHFSPLALWQGALNSWLDFEQSSG